MPEHGAHAADGAHRGRLRAGARGRDAPVRLRARRRGEGDRAQGVGDARRRPPARPAASLPRADPGGGVVVGARGSRRPPGLVRAHARKLPAPDRRPRHHAPLRLRAGAARRAAAHPRGALARPGQAGRLRPQPHHRADARAQGAALRRLPRPAGHGRALWRVARRPLLPAARQARLRAADRRAGRHLRRLPRRVPGGAVPLALLAAREPPRLPAHHGRDHRRRHHGHPARGAAARRRAVPPRVDPHALGPRRPDARQRREQVALLTRGGGGWCLDPRQTPEGGVRRRATT
mmetsp:Transcript_44008/g.145808  ORF Transcript_44008/g.145808 Transcript_44008/m.145808 type:complete len:291 (-) Transcript_44008:139-1011(-)